MLNRPRLRASFDVASLGDRGAFLLDEHRQVALEGALYSRLLPLLDGQRTMAEIAQELSGKDNFQKVLFALSRLERAGYLVEGEDPAELPRDEPGWTAFADYLGLGVRAAAPATRRRVGERARSRVTRVGRVPEFVVDSVRDAGLAIDGGAEFQIVFADDYLRPEIAEIDNEARAAGRPWMLVKPVGMVLWIGPIFVPGETGCWHCLRQRLSANRQLEQYVREQTHEDGEHEGTSVAHLPATLSMATGLAATEFLKWRHGPGMKSLEGRLLTVDLHEGESRIHDLVHRPQCPACGDPEMRLRRGSKPLELESRKKQFTADGGHRVTPPWATMKKYQHHISPILGAVTDVQPALGSHPGIAPSYVAGHNFAMGLDSVVYLRDSLRGMSGGKGTTDIQAQVSALCEAIERYSGLHWGDEPRVRGRYGDVEGALHPNEIMGFSDAQFANREAWNAANPSSRCVLVPPPFNTEREIDWTPVWPIGGGEPRYLPSAYLYYGHPEFDARDLLPDSNGCAAGNTLEEAILQGFLELVERDAVAIWWYNRIRRRAVDLDRIDLPYIQEIRAYYSIIGRRMWVLDITSDLGVPTFACISCRVDHVTDDVILGFGSHLDPSVAVLRAVTEANQFLPAVGLQNPDGTTRYLFGDALARDWWTRARIEEQSYLTPDPDAPPIGLDAYDGSRHDDILDDVTELTRRVQERGHDVYLLDQTLPDIGLPVVRVMVPGMCHFWRRLGHPRMYEAAVAGGFRSTPLSEDDVNPFSVFF